MFGADVVTVGEAVVASRREEDDDDRRKASSSSSSSSDREVSEHRSTVEVVHLHTCKKRHQKKFTLSPKAKSNGKERFKAFSQETERGEERM